MTDNDTSYEKRMKRITCRNLMKIILASIYGINFGYYMAIFNPLGNPLLTSVYKLNDEEFKQIIGNINMLFPIGAFFATLVSGPIAEKIGRRKLIIIYDFMCVGSIALYWIQDLRVLQVTRFLNGYIAAGSGVIGAITLTELLPKTVSGAANAVLYSTIVIFACAAYIQAKFLSRDTMITHWRIILCWPIIPLFLKAVLLPFFFTKESPKYYMKQNATDENVRERIKSIYNDTYRDSKVSEITDLTMAMVEKEIEAGAGNIEVFKRLFTANENRKRVTTGFFLSISQQLSGVALINLYSKDIFDRILGNGNEVTFVLAISKAIAGVVCIISVKVFSRKFNLMAGLLLQSLSLYAIYVASYYQLRLLGTVGAFVHTMGYAIGLGGALNAYLTEILPPVGVSITLSTAWLGLATFGKLIPILAATFGDPMLLLAFSAMGLICFFIMDWRIIETKGKSEAAVYVEFATKPYRYFDFS